MKTVKAIQRLIERGEKNYPLLQKDIEDICEVLWWLSDSQTVTQHDFLTAVCAALDKFQNRLWE